MSENKNNVYVFTKDGKEYVFPLFKDVKMGVMRKARKAKDDSDMLFTIIEEILGEDSEELAMIDNLSGEEFEQFVNGWLQGADLKN